MSPGFRLLRCIRAIHSWRKRIQEAEGNDDLTISADGGYSVLGHLCASDYGKQFG